MSRRNRVEEEKVKQLKDELQEEEDKLNLMLGRIFGPIVWRRYESGIRIEDLQEKYYEATIDLIMDYFLPENVLFRNTNIMNDPLSKKSLTHRLLFKLKDRASIIAIDEANANQIAGLLILNPIHKADFGRVYSRTMLVDGKPYKSIMDFLNYINRKVDIFEQYKCEVYLRYYLLCVAPDYRGTGLGYQLMKVGMDIARHLKIPIAMGLFDNYKVQKLAKKVGMDQTLYEMEYVRWVDDAQELVFCDPGANNYSCTLMAGVVPPPPEPEPVTTNIDNSLKGKITRSDKKKNKAKAEAKKGVR